MRVMPAAPSREPSARRAWSIWPNKPGRPGWTTRAGARELAARAWSGHRLFIIVLTPAVLLRVDAELGYRWHAWFNDSFQYVQNTVHFNLDPTRVSGYSIWLKILQPLHTYAVVTILQHLMALAVAVMIYALARHRFRAPAWLATLATVPVLYDGFEIQLEHLIMADVPFLFLLTLAVTLLLWDPAPSLRRCLLIGALLGLAEIMRSVGLPLLAVFAVYMIIRRISWRKVAATIVVCLVPVFGYAGWFYAEHGQFAMTDSTGVFLYSRVMTFADCTKMKVPANELSLCTTVPPDKRPIAQAYIWTTESPLDRFPPSKFSPVPNQLAENFAIRAIEAQPLDYAKAVFDDTWRVFALEAGDLPERPDLRRVHLRLPLAAHPGLGPGRPRAVRLLRRGVRARQPADPGGRAVRQRHPRLPAVRLAAGHRVRADPAGRPGRHGAGLAAARRGGAAAVDDLARADRDPGRDRRVRLPVRAGGRAVRLPRRGHGVQPGHRGRGPGAQAREAEAAAAVGGC